MSRYRAARAGIARQKLKENITKVNTVDGEGDRKQIETWIPLAFQSSNAEISQKYI